MTEQEIARALEDLIREDAKRLPEEQIRELIEAGIIDQQGRVLIGNRATTAQDRKAERQNGAGGAPSPRKIAGG